MSDRERSVLAMHVDACPSLVKYLDKLCDRCDRKGELQGSIKLGGAETTHEERRRLQAIFGTALRLSQSGEARLNLNRFLTDIAAREDWIAELYQTAGRQPRNLSAQAEYETKLMRLLLEQLRLAFPELDAVHCELRTSYTQTSLTRQQIAKLRSTWFPLARTVAFLRQNRQPIGLSDLGARYFNDSKALRTGRRRRQLVQWLALMQGNGADDNSADAATVLAAHGVTDNPTSIKVTFFGNFRYYSDGHWLDWPCELRKRGQSVTLSLDNLAKIERAEFDEGTIILTCENETPFNNLIRAGMSQPVVYTAGFPNAAVQVLLAILPATVQLQHWGDSDRAGYQIARILSQLRPLSLWRCRIADLQRCRQALRPLPEKEKNAIHRLLRENPDHPFAAELAFTAANGWLEQENWQELCS